LSLVVIASEIELFAKQAPYQPRDRGATGFQCLPAGSPNASRKFSDSIDWEIGKSPAECTAEQRAIGELRIHDINKKHRYESIHAS
jgi:hypothetical protein